MLKTLAILITDSMDDKMVTATILQSKGESSETVSLEQIYRRADWLMLLLVWVLFAIAVSVGWYYEHTSTALIAGAILALSSSLIKMLFPGKLITRLFYAFTLLGFAALLIQLGEGETEFHFSVFVLLSALLAYRDYRPLLMGAITAAVHHLLFNYLQENDLYGIVCFMHPGFHMVVFHAVFVVAQTAILIYMAVHMARDARSASEVAQLASHINREAGCLTLDREQRPSHSAFARTFSATLKTMRNTLGQVSHGIAMVQGDAESILRQNSALSQRTDEQASALAVVASAMAQLTSVSTYTSEKALLAQELSLQASNVAARGDENISATIQTMAQIREESVRISNILEIIDGIAFQTNILSLNASVEAARAGVHGKGFSVVATEVRMLAQRCENAAKEIRQLIAVAVSCTQTGSRQVSAAGVTMQEVMSSITQLSQLVDELSEMSVQQRVSIAQMHDSIAKIDSSVQENISHVAETVRVAQQQGHQADALKRAISVFRLA